MKELISKLQYKNFEPGEFIEEKKRKYEETIQLIETFPWNEQRDHIIIDLTNPSITIEGENNDYLKLAIFFNAKFVLHYLNAQKILFTKSFTDFKDSYKYIRNFFELSSFDMSDFKQENTWLKNNIIHFVSQDFNYIVDSKNIKRFLISTSGMNFGISLFFLLLFLIEGTGKAGAVGVTVILIMLFIIGGGINLILFFNYYFYSRNKILIMSKGSDIFYFGNINDPIKYNKKDIKFYEEVRGRGKSIFTNFAVITIEFINGNQIQIPNLFLFYSSLEEKLYQCKRIDKGGIPLVRSTTL
jgi:hypothetical protein